MDGGLVFLVVCEEGYPREVAYYCLEQVRRRLCVCACAAGASAGPARSPRRDSDAGAAID